jgi:hypothetical protein
MITNKIAIGAGAIALAVTASLTPLVALAEPGSDSDSSSSSSDSSSSSGVGNAAGRKAAQTNRGGAVRPGTNTPSQSPVSGTQAEANTPPQSVVSGARPATRGANALGPNPLFQNPLWWFGTPNPNPPPTVATRTFEPLASLPGWSQGYYGWYRNLNFEACVLGVSNSITPSVGPYGTSTSSISTGGC